MNLFNKSKKSPKSKSRKTADQEAEAKLEDAKAKARKHRRNKKKKNENSNSSSSNSNSSYSQSPIKSNNKNKKGKSKLNLLDLNASLPHKNNNQIGERGRPTQSQKSRSLDLNDNFPNTERHQALRRRTRQKPKQSSMKREDGRIDRRRRSSISFCEQLEVKDIIPLKDLVDDTRKLWWNNQEYQQIVELSCATVNLARVDKTTYTRGLEDLMRDDHAATFKTRNDVLLAQKILRRKKVKDDEALSGLYGRSTAKYNKEAELRAEQDAKEVQTYLADTRRKARRTWSV
ncbi:unnamed protein product [Cylindrotheca closterium]|uniref:Uncharacterized protein n=1 Tax=Cylindrotheca closterium TaxID=2856 RepID=A0AAD2G7J6_9STRA|nr:unnamed protein product [Cylindrotheca closterium]